MVFLVYELFLASHFFSLSSVPCVSFFFAMTTTKTNTTNTTNSLTSSWHWLALLLLLCLNLLLFVQLQESIQDARTEMGKLWAGNSDLWLAIGRARQDKDIIMQSLFHLQSERSERRETRRQINLTTPTNPTKPTTPPAILCNISHDFQDFQLQRLHSALLSACNQFRPRQTVSYHERSTTYPNLIQVQSAL